VAATTSAEEQEPLVLVADSTASTVVTLVEEYGMQRVVVDSVSTAVVRYGYLWVTRNKGKPAAYPARTWRLEVQQ
jgi:hypothetical protein